MRLVAAAAALAASGPALRAAPSEDEDRVAAFRRLAATAPSALRNDARTLRPTLRHALTKDKLPEVRALAARVWLRLDGPDAAGPVVEAMGRERDPAAERGLAAAWSEVTDDAGRRVLAAAAGDRTDERRAALCAEALGQLPEAAGRDDLAGLLAAPSPWAVEAGACLGLRAVRTPRALDLLVARLRHPDPAVRSAARESASALAGTDHGTDPTAWERWWDGARATFPPAAAAEPSGEPLGDPRGGGAGPGETTDRRDGRPTFARFFGIELRGSRIAFVIDYSQSMWGARRERAERELVAAAKGLPSTSTFSVVLFNERVWWLRDGPLPARPQEKLDLVRFLPEQETKSYTNLHDALEEALGLLGVGAAARTPAPGLDEIVVLSDGVPNRGRIRDPDRLLDAVTTLNAGRARIHAVSLGPPTNDLLRRVAAANGGRFVIEPIAK